MSAHKRILRREFTGKVCLKTTDHCKTKALLSNFSPSSPRVVSQRDGKTLKNGSFLCEMDNVLSRQECAEIVKNADECIFEEVSDKYRFGKQRNNRRLLLLDKELAENLWQNIEPLLSKEVEELKLSKQPLGFDVRRGEWELHGLNEAMRVNKYSSKKKEHFSPHKDAQYCPSGDERSLFTLLVYLNEDFQGGETCFYFPKDIAVNTKGMTTQEEIDAHGGLKEGFTCVTVVPVVGHAVLFSQNILHESVPILRDSKYILKTDVVVKRHSKQFGFAVEDKEKDDYLACLNYFREAQQQELQRNFQNASDLYERALSIRYCYPRNLVTAAESSAIKGNGQSGHLLLPLDVWQHIFKYLPGHDAQNLVYAYPQLNVAKECWERHERNHASSLFSQSYLPKINYQEGIITRLEFSDADFFRENVDGCCRVAAMYSFFLLSHKPEDDVYTVRYNPDTQDVCAVALETLLTDVFYNRRCYGSFYNVRQQDPKVKDPQKDFEACVDRSYMFLRHGAQFLGVELTASFNVESTAYHVKSDDESEDEEEEEEEEWDEESDEEEEEVEEGKEKEESEKEKELEGTEDQTEEMKEKQQIKEICDGSVPFYGEIDRSFEVSWLVRKFIQAHSRLCGVQDDFWYSVRDDFLEEMFAADETPGYEVFFKALEDMVASRNKVSCTLVSKLKEPLHFDSNSVCICYHGPNEEIVKYIGDSCTTEFYNHLVFDFEMAQISVEFTGEEAKCYDCKLLHPIHFKKVASEQELNGYDGKAMFYKVNIESILSPGTSFNHASCQCGNPRFEVHEYHNLKDYPYLNHIHLVAREKGGKMIVWTVYGGVVAL